MSRKGDPPSDASGSGLSIAPALFASRGTIATLPLSLRDFGKVGDLGILIRLNSYADAEVVSWWQNTHKHAVCKERKPLGARWES
jgi:hypothetical protein